MKNKTALITGATKGIGPAITERLIKKGYQVIGIARNDSETPYPGVFFPCDLSDITKTAETLDKIKKSYQVDVIVNNVGISSPEALGEIDLNTLSAVYDLNVRSAVQITQAFVDQMKQNHFGRIINISSRAAIRPVKNRSSYAGAKSALIGITKTWALELATYGITVNAVAPGPTETELFRQARPVGSVAEKDTLFIVPMNRIGKPDEIAAGVEFLISDDAAFITGQTLRIDGGTSL
ncbi:MAG: SDR family oxidoreductase [Gammaproteobacteria bacterium]|nr:SDR family oxidoreductase [Gammaproteobacteria bacterium]